MAATRLRLSVNSSRLETPSTRSSRTKPSTSKLEKVVGKKCVFHCHRKVFSRSVTRVPAKITIFYCTWDASSRGSIPRVLDRLWIYAAWYMKLSVSRVASRSTWESLTFEKATRNHMWVSNASKFSKGESAFQFQNYNLCLKFDNWYLKFEQDYCVKVRLGLTKYFEVLKVYWDFQFIESSMKVVDRVDSVVNFVVGKSRVGDSCWLWKGEACQWPVKGKVEKTRKVRFV